jgi:outer membrane protein TolC
MHKFWLLIALGISARAETHSLTLKQAADRALAQNPEVVMARLEELKASQGAAVAKNPFSPHVNVGSGLAYSSGFPLSIEGSAPAAFEAKADAYLLNRPQSYAIAQAKESARGAGFATGAKSDEIAYRVASIYIDVDRAARLADAAQSQVENLQRVLETARARVEEGRELTISEQEANLNLLRAQQRLLTLQTDRDYAEHNLAATLGYDAADTVVPAVEEIANPVIPDGEEAALATALNSSKELKRLESNYTAKELEMKGDRAQRLPRVDLVAQYALLTSYSNYQEYFARFQRNNGQVGASIQIPVYLGTGQKAVIAQVEADEQHLKAEMQAERNRITLEMHQSYQEVRKTELAKQLAQADLDLARAQLSIVLAQLGEGRATLRQVEEARFAENEKWIAFYDAQFTAERARFNVLRQTGELRVALTETRP